MIEKPGQEQPARRVELTNPAVNGFTTIDLIRHELPEVRAIKPDLVTILIGVNDLVRDVSPDSYRATLVRIYDAVAKEKAPDGRVFAVSIPNWPVVPAAREDGDPARIRDLTDTFNDIAREEADKRGFGGVDITAASLSALAPP